MEQLIEVAKTLRLKHRFHGYIHLKVVAGSSEALIQEAGKWADRLSANIEMPVQADLNLLAPAKTLESATTSMNQIAEKVSEFNEEKARFKNTPNFAPAGQTTQMIVGATESSDALILASSDQLYKKYNLKRVYYSAYSPIPNADALLPVKKPSLVRENRLYQADWLLRFYGFNVNELVNTEDPQLSLEMDPKTAWALKNRHFFPVDVNGASREQLLRVPGFGVRTVDRLLQMRPYKKIRLEDLQKLRIPINRAKYFVIVSDHNPNAFLLDHAQLSERLNPVQHVQLSLFETTVTAKTGEI
jgi:putative DNA modification/repair radical SAM protein